MQVSKKELKPDIETKLNQIFIQLLRDIESAKEAELIANAMFSETERVAIMKRLGIACMLQEHAPYEKIKKDLNVSSATIATVQSLMSQDGMRLILDKIKISLLADQWTTKVKHLFSVFSKKNSV